MLLVLAGLAAPAHAEMRALLVGVSSYPTLDKRHQLEGPRNDVRLMRELLLQRGFAAAQITLLADGLSEAAPTRGNILAALDRLAATAQPGDTVFIHFAGHGSQQPVDRNTPEGKDEPDGLSETFLPQDVGRWDGDAHTVKNAIVDHELRARVDHITDRGAFVWGVFDACHSATLVRGSDERRLRYRRVDPLDLGLKKADFTQVRPGTSKAQTGALGNAAHTRGGSAFFYAAQTTEPAPEFELPLGDPRHQAHGLFSFMVARALALGEPMSYRQMSQYVLTQYGAISDSRATPLFSGTGLDTAVLGQQALPVRQWPLSLGPALRVPVGSLAMVAKGAVFAVVAGPLSKSDDALGYLQATSVELAAAELEPVARAGRPAPKPGELKPGAYARLVSSPLEYVLRVAVDASACPRDCAVAATLAQLQTQSITGADVQWVRRDDGPDVLVELHRDRVLFLPPTQQGDDAAAKRGAVGFATAGKDSAALAQALASHLHAIARSRNLLRLAARYASAPHGNALTVTLKHLPAAGHPLQVIAAERVPLLRNKDKLALTMANPGAKALDVTVLYADANYGIQSLFPSVGEINRLEPGSSLTIDDIGIEANEVVGIERVLVITAEATPQTERADFSRLGQAALNTQRGQESDDMKAFLDAAFADYATRGSSQPAVPSGRTGMQVFTFNVQR